MFTQAADVFGGEPSVPEPAGDLKVLHAKIGQWALENDFWKTRSSSVGMLNAKR